jgi:diketogulonate reductase-like aldo/keto reductase
MISGNKSSLFPKIIYGTAWKKDKTTDLVVQAVLSGFRAIDTACQPKHYREDLVGNALEILSRDHNIQRTDLFIQTKFTSVDGQDPKNIPYDQSTELTEQVKQSMKKSLENLKTDYIDSLVLHSPMKTYDNTMKVWRCFEEFCDNGWVRQIGISNIYNFSLLEQIYEAARIKPSVIQNRFYADSGYDKEIRKFCLEKGIAYQSFWTLTGNPMILGSSLVKQMAKKYNVTPEQLFFKFVMQIGITPLTGTTDSEHMKQDLEVVDLKDLSGDEVASIEKMLN